MDTERFVRIKWHIENNPHISKSYLLGFAKEFIKEVERLNIENEKLKADIVKLVNRKAGCPNG